MNMPENKFARISKLKKMDQSEQHPDTDQAFKKPQKEPHDPVDRPDPRSLDKPVQDDRQDQKNYNRKKHGKKDCRSINKKHFDCILEINLHRVRPDDIGIPVLQSCPQFIRNRNILQKAVIHARRNFLCFLSDDIPRLFLQIRIDSPRVLDHIVCFR